jgi:hypothetical protein
VFRRTALLATAATAAALFLTPAANAEAGHNLDADLVPGRGVAFDHEGNWAGRVGFPFEFSVAVANTGGRGDTDLSVFVSVPFEVTGYRGEGWSCWDVDGGVDCSIPDLVVDGEQWPLLTIEAVADQRWLVDAVDAYADSRHGDVHAGVGFVTYEAG